MSERVNKTDINNGAEFKLKPRYPKARRKIHRTYLAWLEGNQGRFKCQLQFVYREDHILEMAIPMLNHALTIFLTEGSLGVSVNWKGTCWDYLVCFDAVPTPSAEGYYCALLKPEHRIYYPNRQALWQAELFEPFLEWLNANLIPAHRLGLYRIHGCTWAELLQQPDSEASVILPVWLRHGQETNHDG